MTETRTETDAAAELAGKPVFTREGERGDLIVATTPPYWGVHQIDLERFGDEPRRSRGEVLVGDAESFVKAVQRRRITDAPSPVVYADESRNMLVAILNDDDNGIAGWRDYHVGLLLRPTPEWSHWKGADGRLMSQDAFAQHVEDGLTELVDPDAATMLEIAQTFHATTSAKFKSGTRLASGAQQFQYEEDVTAGAGGAGTLEIPSRLQLVMAPFFGSARYEVGAWFRFRLTREQFSLGYKLDRPHEVERAAFADVRTAVQEGLDDLTFISGPAPIGVSPQNAAREVLEV